jgi:hypothetical protein
MDRIIGSIPAALGMTCRYHPKHSEGPAGAVASE